jgi:hypothetical protein
MKYKFLKFINNVHTPKNKPNIQAGVTKHEPAVWLLLAQPAVSKYTYFNLKMEYILYITIPSYAYRRKLSRTFQHSPKW